MGSFCCVAARPQAAGTTSHEWSSIGRSDQFWRAERSFSPSLSTQWEYRYNSEERVSNGSQGDGTAVSYETLLSSENSKRSQSWRQGEHRTEHQYSASEGVASLHSSPESSFPNQLLTPSPLQCACTDEFIRVPASESADSSLFLEGSKRPLNDHGSTSSCSDGSEYAFIPKAQSSTARNPPSRRSFMSKPIHPLSFSEHAVRAEEVYNSLASTSSIDFTLHRATFDDVRSPGVIDPSCSTRGGSAKWSSTSSFDLTDVSEIGSPNNMCSSSVDCTRCSLCERLLSKRSPWGSRRIICSGDMPVAGVLSCCHVYHAECLERTTPKGQKHDPPCPVCDKQSGKDADNWAICKLKNGLPRFKSLGEGPSRVWSFGQAGRCAGGASQLQATKTNGIAPLSRSRLKRHLSFKGNTSQD